MAECGLGLQSLGKKVQDVGLPVSGDRPAWLCGTLFRNAPAKSEAGAGTMRPWFDCQAMLHRLAENGGPVSCANRHVENPSGRAVSEGRARSLPAVCHRRFRSSVARFSTPFLRQRPTFLRQCPANPNVNVARCGERLVALTETPIPFEFDREALAAVGVADCGDGLNGRSTTAHQLQGSVKGDRVNRVTHFSRCSECRVCRQREISALCRELLGTCAVRQPSCMQGFAIAVGSVVLAEFPLMGDSFALLLSGRPFIDTYRRQPEPGTLFVVMNRSDGRVRAVLHAPTGFPSPSAPIRPP